MTIAEPAVALTDYLLAAECALCAWLLVRSHASAQTLRRWFVVFFAATGLGALVGGTVHGFMTEPSVGHAIAWRFALVAIAGGPWTMWKIAANFLGEADAARRVRHLADVLFAAYAVAVTIGFDAFGVVVIYSVPAVLFLLIVYGRRYASRREGQALWGALGLLLMMTAAAVQQARMALDAPWFDHNATFHAVQAVALVPWFVAARGYVRPDSSRSLNRSISSNA